MKVTICQKTVLDFIKDYITTHGYPPTISEIANGVGCVKSVAHYHFHNLLDSGLLETDSEVNSNRAYRVTGMKVVMP